MKKNWGKFYSQIKDFEYIIQNASCHLPIFRSIFKENPKRILEIGTGTGSMSILLSYLGYELVSIDNDKNVLEKAELLNRLLNGKVKFLYKDAFKLNFEKNYFDITYHQGLLEHFSDGQIYELIDQQLNVSKIVVLSVPNNYYPLRDFGDERLLKKEYWDKLLRKRYQLLESKEYNPYSKMLFKGRIVLSIDNTMYLAKLTRK